MATNNNNTTTTTKKPSKKKKSSQNPETNFLINLNSYSKSKDLQSAISLYESQHQNLRLNLHHFNSLLYLCSNSASNADTESLAFDYGFRIFRQMLSKNITPNEATITAVARLSAAKGDGDYAFEVVKNMGEYGIAPRLRTYDPALLCFCRNLEADKAYEVEEHMGSNGVGLEEAEIAGLLRVSAETGRVERVYGYLHKLRSNVRCVSEETGKIVEDWFRSEKGCGVGGGGGGVGVVVREVVERNGGGWHGLGWIGEGKWVVRRGSVEESGRCCCCGEHLVCVDIDEVERERFARSVAGLAMEREVKGNFTEFQDWLEKHAHYEAIVDGANIGLYQQNFAEGGFSVPQLDDVVKELYKKGENKWPLIILHNKRLRALLENPSHRELVKDWIDKGVLYTTPHGSNDDWYWLYAAVKFRCLLVTNDEMRDHIFELLGSSFFLKWKERHQVRYTIVKGNLKLQMPPAYSLVIQESEKGSWHVPIAVDSNEGAARIWLCITRPSSCEASEEAPVNMEISENGHDPSGNPNLLNSCESGGISSHNNNNGSQDSFQDSDNKTTTVTGKRKERSSNN